jgi:hypothetical protein
MRRHHGRAPWFSFRRFALESSSGQALGFLGPGRAGGFTADTGSTVGILTGADTTIIGIKTVAAVCLSRRSPAEADNRRSSVIRAS